MNYQKITHGYVVQEYDEKGFCIGQEFIAGDQVEYEKDGNSIEPTQDYYPFYMVQPFYKPELANELRIDAPQRPPRNV